VHAQQHSQARKKTTCNHRTPKHTIVYTDDIKQVVVMADDIKQVVVMANNMMVSPVPQCMCELLCSQSRLVASSRFANEVNLFVSFNVTFMTSACVRTRSFVTLHTYVSVCINMPVLLSLPGNLDDKLLLQTCNSITEIVRNSTTVITSLAEYRGKYVSIISSY